MINYLKICKKSILLTALVLVIVLSFLSSGYSQFYNGSQMSFGKNRIQYKEFLWTYYKFENLDIYFYLNGRELAITTAKYATEQIPLMEKKLQTGLEQKIQFLVYNNLTDLKQSNIGLVVKSAIIQAGLPILSAVRHFCISTGIDVTLKSRSGLLLPTFC